MSKHVIGVGSAKLDEATGDIELALKGPLRKTYSLKFSRHCVPQVITILRYIMSVKNEKFVRTRDLSEFVLTGTQQFRNPSNGNRGLVLTLDASLPIAVVLNAEAVDDLRTRLAHWDDPGGPPPSSQTQH